MTGQTTVSGDNASGRWRIDPGLYDLRIGTSSTSIEHTATVAIHDIAATQAGHGRDGDA
ncbi:MAG: hypothetical protein ACKOBT_05355 [Actinomycetota bacterium]